MPPDQTSVLIVDDGPECQATADIVASAGFECIVANSAAEALDTIKSKEIDLVLSELKLPDSLGIDLVRSIRSKHNSWKIPIVITASHNDSQHLIDCLAAGANDYIPKPLSPKVTRAKIVNRIHLREQHENLSKIRENNQRTASQAIVGQMISDISTKVNPDLYHINNATDEIFFSIVDSDDIDARKISEMSDIIQHYSQNISENIHVLQEIAYSSDNMDISTFDISECIYQATSIAKRTVQQTNLVFDLSDASSMNVEASYGLFCQIFTLIITAIVEQLRSEEDCGINVSTVDENDTVKVSIAWTGNANNFRENSYIQICNNYLHEFNALIDSNQKDDNAQAILTIPKKRAQE